MDIRTYLDEKKMTMIEFASMCRVTRYCLYRIMAGQRKPSGPTIQMIILASSGKIKEKDILAYRKKLDEKTPKA